MRSACWGARSLRSLMTMRPLVVSITIALDLSRLAGSGCAIAGLTQISAAMSARARIMETPDRVMGSRRQPRNARFLNMIFSENVSTFPDHALAEFGLEALGDRRWHEGRDVPAHTRDLAHQCGRDRADGGRGRNEHRMHVRRHGLVHARDLHFVVEIGAIA